MSKRIAVSLVAVVILGLSCSARAEGDLVAHYTFEEGPTSKVVKDWSGYGNHGKIIDDVQYVKLEEGKGYALRFNSGKAHVDCGNKPSLDLTDAVTIELWFHPETSIRKGEGGVVGKVMGSYCLSYSGKCWFYVPAGANYGSTAPLSLSWHHVAATFDGTATKMYVDGKLQGVQKSRVKKLPHGENFFLRYPATYLEVEPEYKCTMDDVRVYNRALSEEEIVAHYRREAKSTGRHDTTWFDKVKLTPHVFPQSSTLVVGSDVVQMGLRSPGCTLTIELRDAANGKVMAKHETPVKTRARETADKKAAIRLEFKDLERLGVGYWTVNVKGFPHGDYDIRAVVTNKNGGRVGVPSSVRLMLPLEKPDWIKAYDDTKILNNLVAELLSVKTPQTGAQKEYSFTNPRTGWVFISTTAETQGADKVLVSVDAEPEAAIVHAEGKDRTLEAMRHLPAGRHTLRVRCEGAARPTALVVRAIPEMMVAGLGYHNLPFLRSFGHYNAAYLDRIGLLDSINMIIERTSVAENASYVKAWKEQGKKLIVRYGMWPIWQTRPTADSIFKVWTECRGLAGDDYDGMIADEFSGLGHGGVGNYVLYSEAARRIAQDARFKGKVFYPYCMPMYYGDTAMDFLKTVVGVGYKWAQERYNVEQPTERAALDFMDLRLRQDLLRYNRTFPGCARHMITTLGFMSAPPETLNVSPAVDFKVYMDMQMHLLANDPAFFALYGIQWYHNGYVDEEDLRWSAKLFRHYGIEGKKERLTSDPYMLPHIANPDFDDGDVGWTLRPAEQGSISIQHATGYGILQTRCRGGNEIAGDNFLVTTRSAKAPNRFSQKIGRLAAGRLYSVKMFTADYDEMKKGKSTQRKHHINIKIDGVELIPGKAFHELFASGRAGHTYGPFDRKNNLYLTYHRVVFRASKETAALTVSDWESNEKPGGPIGRRLMHNFVELQPYLDDSDLPPLQKAPPRRAAAPVAVVPDEEAIRNAPDSAPVARYLLDEGAGDTAQNTIPDGPHARIHGAKYVKSAKGHALSFDGNDDYVRVTDRKALNISGANLTVECWFKAKDPKAKWRGLCGNYHSGTGGYMLVYTSEGVAFYNAAPPGGPSGPVKVKEGKWHHAVGVLDNGTMLLYVDGVRQSAVKAGQTVKSSTYPFEIGRYGFGKSFSGDIDDVAVYHKPLSHAEIMKRYRKGKR